MRLHSCLPPHTDQADAIAHGKALRARCSFDAQGALLLPEGRDVLALIDAAHTGRVPELIGVRVSRMLQSAFAFYRATADVMTADLAAGPRTDVRLVIGGDAHLSNFGLYASAERRLLFDLNDFDESGWGPWEWDLKRLAASVVLVQRSKDAGGGAQRKAAAAAVSAYQQMLRTYLAQAALERYYASVDAAWLQQAEASAQLDRSVRRAMRNTGARVLGRITSTRKDGSLRIEEEPPILVRRAPEFGMERMRTLLAAYIDTLRADRAMLMSKYRLVDVARRVVGVGSVGTRCGIALLQGPAGEALFMQIKQAQPSVLARYGQLGDVTLARASAAPPQGARVVSSQQVLQAASDPLLGWSTDADTGIDYYWRQFRDMKGAVDLDALPLDEATRYGELCGRQLARAHVQSPDAAVVSGYIGSSDALPENLARWAVAYADQVESDFAVFQQAVKDGRYPVTAEAA